MNRKKFQKSLGNLSGWRERAFILCLSERALPNAILYLQSVQEEKKLSYKLFDRAWQNLIISPNEEGIVSLLDQAIECIALTEDTEHYGARPTQDCFRLLEQALLSGLNTEKKRALEASQSSLSTITDFIEFSEGDSLSENALIKLFDSHPLIEREFSFQDEISELLRSAKHPGKDLIDSLRQLSQDEGVSNIGISL